VKPVPGSCVINLADSLVRFTAGILKSNIRRVAPAPGLQTGLPRFSLVYFAHPNDDVPLVPVKGGLVDAAVTTAGGLDDGIKATAAKWVVRRSLGDLRGVYTYKGGIELRELNDAVPFVAAA
jgi:isopenicillin N synthase-like dioxygenase